MSIDDPNNIFDPIHVSYATEEPTEFREKFFDQIEKISPAIQDLLYGTETKKRIQRIAEEYHLTHTQILFFTCIIRDVAVGFLYFGDLVTELKNKLDLPDEIAKKLAVTVTTDIFDFALEDIKKLQVATFPDRIQKIMNPPAAGQPAAVPEQDDNVINLREQS